MKAALRLIPSVMLTSGVIVMATLAAAPANAGVSNKHKTVTAGCIKSHGVSKSAQATVRAGAIWNKPRTHLHDGYSDVRGRAVDCIRATGLKGTVKIWNSGHAVGVRITHCDVGTAGVGCHVATSDKSASWSDSLKKKSTSAKGRTIDVGGIDINTSSRGVLTDFYSTGKTRLYYGGSTATANATVHVVVKK
jgi:hypothetical protein